MIPQEEQLKLVLKSYQKAFVAKVYSEENDDHDVLMDAFGLVPQLKRENRQYWGRELGMCWEKLIVELFDATTPDYKPGYREGADELCDLISGMEAIDTKYRIGSGDSGTLKKFKLYGNRLRELGFVPVLLIVRQDNLPAAINSCRGSHWEVFTGQATFDYVQQKTNVDLKAWLTNLGKQFHIVR